MTRDKAIEILIDLLGVGPQFSPEDRREAVSLGIEALKKLKYLKEHNASLEGISLLGETEE